MTTAAAAVVVAAVWIGSSVRNEGVYAVLETGDASLSRISDMDRVPVGVGDRIGAQETVRSNGGGGAVLALTDGPRVEMRSRSELSLERADDGVRIRLRTGSIIVNAAKQRTGGVRTVRDGHAAARGVRNVLSRWREGVRDEPGRRDRRNRPHLAGNPRALEHSAAESGPGRYDWQVSVIDPTGRRAAFWQAPIAIVP
jgi:hypothetical protein